MNAPKDPRLLLLWNLYSTDNDEPGEVTGDLYEMGYDLRALTRHGRELLREVKGRLDLEIRAQKTREDAQKAEIMREKVRARLMEEPDPKVALLSMLHRAGSTKQAVFFRKIEKLSVEDALEILSDAQLLEILHANPESGGDDRDNEIQK